MFNKGAKYYCPEAPVSTAALVGTEFPEKYSIQYDFYFLLAPFRSEDHLGNTVYNYCTAY